MIKIDVPYINQSENYPTGCESVTTVMLLHYLGYDISVDDFIKNNLEMRDLETRDGVLYGPNPWECFVGSPYNPDSMGCYAPVICKALRSIVEDEYEVIDETGKDLDDLVETYLKNGMPVILWNSINMREPIIGPKWKLLNSGEEFIWISNEHCMLLVGEDEDSYIFNDPYENRGVIACPKDIILDRYDVYHRQAVGLKRKMKGYNLIVVFNEAADRMLMCKRKKDPYKGLSNFVGGKIEEGEKGLDAAYRELKEETGITSDDIVLTHLMDFTYCLDNCYVEVYVGKLNKQVAVAGDENELYWSTLDKDFFSMDYYAGEGNIGHIMEHVKMSQDKLWGK